MIGTTDGNISPGFGWTSLHILSVTIAVSWPATFLPYLDVYHLSIRLWLRPTDAIAVRTELVPLPFLTYSSSHCLGTRPFLAWVGGHFILGRWLMLEWREYSISTSVGAGSTSPICRLPTTSGHLFLRASYGSFKQPFLRFGYLFRMLCLSLRRWQFRVFSSRRSVFLPEGCTVASPTPSTCNPLRSASGVRLWVLLHGLRLGNLLRQLALVRRILETWHSSSFTGFFPPLIASHCSIGFRTRRVHCATTSELIWNMCFVTVLLPGHSESHCVVFFSLCSRMSRPPSPYCLLPSFLVCVLLQPPLLLYGRLLLFSGNFVSIYRYIV